MICMIVANYGGGKISRMHYFDIFDKYLVKKKWIKKEMFSSYFLRGIFKIKMVAERMAIYGILKN